MLGYELLGNGDKYTLITLLPLFFYVQSEHETVSSRQTALNCYNYT